MAFEAMLAGEMPQAIVWPLILTWTLSVSVLPSMWAERWLSACKMLGLEGANLEEKLDGLDHFLDGLEQALEDRSAGQGF